MYVFIDCHRGRYTVRVMDGTRFTHHFTPRSYYDYRKGICGKRGRPRKEIQSVYARAYSRYGAPRIAVDIRPDPGKVWVSDIIYILRGFRYLTPVIDLYYRKVVGWSFSSNLTARDTACRAYEVAVRNRKPAPGMIFCSTLRKSFGIRWPKTWCRACLEKVTAGTMP